MEIRQQPVWLWRSDQESLYIDEKKYRQNYYGRHRLVTVRRSISQ